MAQIVEYLLAKLERLIGKTWTFPTFLPNPESLENRWSTTKLLCLRVCYTLSPGKSLAPATIVAPLSSIVAPFSFSSKLARTHLADNRIQRFC